MKQQGFTLIEVMVSLVLMALLSSMAYKGMSSLMQARDVVTNSTEQTLAIQSALSQWTIDWTGANNLKMRPGVQYSGNGIRMVRQYPQSIGQVVAWRNGRDGLERRTWAPTLKSSELLAQWNSAWIWTERAGAKAPADKEAVIEQWPMLRDMRLVYHIDGSWGNPFNTNGYDGWPDAVRLILNSPNGNITLDWVGALSTGSRGGNKNEPNMYD